MASATLPRRLRLDEVVRSKSCFLWGPRQTGKSTLITHTLQLDRYYNLLESDVFLALARSPERLRQDVQKAGELICIDEIQRLPGLLNEVHALIEAKQTRFVMTASSPRKLRRGGENLLGGRARSRRLRPFVRAELGRSFDLGRALERGLLPPIYSSDAPDEDLAAYCGDYLQTEIAAEGLSRNVPAFSRFLEVAALSSGQMLNFTKIGADAQVARTTVTEYFQILRDTLIGEDLPPWRGSKKRKAIGTAKFYFFDLGVTRFLQGRKQLAPKTPEFGAAFEQYIFHELRSYLDYEHPLTPLHYWRSRSGFEVDFLVADSLAVEVKSTANVQPADGKGLHALREELDVQHAVIVSLETKPRRIGDIEVLPWALFLDRLWGGDFQVER
jgi:predicted AAA+ superfamily ATPase